MYRINHLPVIAYLSHFRQDNLHQIYCDNHLPVITYDTLYLSHFRRDNLHQIYYDNHLPVITYDTLYLSHFRRDNLHVGEFKKNDWQFYFFCKFSTSVNHFDLYEPMLYTDPSLII
jgi:hypothetical protein